MLITKIAIVLSTLAGPVFGQTISFVRELNGIRYQQATATAAVDATGVYMVGWEGASPSSGTGLIRKHDAQGNELWSRRLENKRLSSVAVGAAGGIYVAGPGEGLAREAFVSKLDSQGTLVWTRQVGSGVGVLVATDNSGIYMTWTPEEGPRQGVILRKFTGDGDVLWTARPAFEGTFREISLGLAANATGVYLNSLESEGRGVLRRFTAAGQEVWTGRTADRGSIGMAVDASGVYVMDVWPGSLHKYGLGGDELWSRQVGTGNSLATVAADASGVYVGGFVEKNLPGQCATGSYDAAVRRYTADGGEVWTRQFGLPGDAGGRAGGLGAASLAVDSGAVYMMGLTGQGKPFLARLDKTPIVIPTTRPHIYWECVVNAASYIGGGVAPGEIVSIFGSGIGPSELARLRLADDGRLATTLAETRVLFNGVPAPLLYVSGGQSSAIVPYAVAGRPSVEVQVEYRGVRSDAVIVPVLAARPGIFSIDGSGVGKGAILNEDGSLNSPSNPARRGSIVAVYATGGGEGAPGVADGQILDGALPTTSLAASAFFDFDYVYGEEPPTQGEVVYAGGSSGSVAGLLQVNVRVPPDAALRAMPSDAVPVALRIGPYLTPFQTTIAVR